MIDCCGIFSIRHDRILSSRRLNLFLASTERPTICADVGLVSTKRVRVLTSGGPSGFAKPRSRKDNDAIPPQSGDRAADPFIPASFAGFDRAMVRTLRQTRIHQPLFKTDVESLASHAQCNVFARPIGKCGNKTRQPEVCCGDATLGVE